MRLIDADALIDDIKNNLWDWETVDGITATTVLKQTISDIGNQPIIEERKTGKWIELTNTNHTYVCSVCGRMLVNITHGKNKVAEHYPFCHCGARMVQEGEERG